MPPGVHSRVKRFSVDGRRRTTEAPGNFLRRRLGTSRDGVRPTDGEGRENAPTIRRSSILLNVPFFWRQLAFALHRTGQSGRKTRGAAPSRRAAARVLVVKSKRPTS